MDETLPVRFLYDIETSCFMKYVFCTGVLVDIRHFTIESSKVLFIIYIFIVSQLMVW